MWTDFVAENTWSEEEKQREREQKDKDKKAKEGEKTKGADYYAILNVPRDAPNESIRAAYKALAMTYHPDIHSSTGDSELVSEAKEKFTLIKTAYETLIDDKKRTLYDLYGAEGVQAGWELGEKYKTVEEMLREYKKAQKVAEELKEEARLERKSAIKVNLDATNLVDPLTGERKSMEVSGMSISQSVKCPLNDRDYAVVGGQLNAANGNGYGYALFALHKFLSPQTRGFCQFITGTDRAVFIVGSWRKLSRHSEAQISTTIESGGVSAILHITRQLSEEISSSITWTVGAFPSLSVGLQKNSEKTQLAAELKTDSYSAAGSIKIKRLLSKKTSVDVSASLSTNGMELTAGGERNVSKHSTIGFSVTVMYPEAILLGFRFQRGGQKLTFPVLVSSSISWERVFSAFVVPGVVMFLLKLFWIEPMRRKRKQRKLQRLRQETAEATAKAKKNAESSVRLMQNTVTRKRSQEEAKRGLIIIQAWYGNLLKVEPDSIKNDEFPSVIDVTIPLQFLVENSEMHLHSGTKANLLGLYDPCPGEEKQLFIQYLFKDKLHEVTIEDSEAIGIPRQRDLKM